MKAADTKVTSESGKGQNDIWVGKDQNIIPAIKYHMQKKKKKGKER